VTHPFWPLWDICIRTARLELRPVREADVSDLVDLAARGIHDPATMPFLTPFTDLPSPERERSSLQFYAGAWANWSVDRWVLPLVARADGTCVGTQSVEAEDFVVRRTVTTGSWLGSAHQGQGLGTEMRAGALALAFAGLGAVSAETGAFEDNTASLRVTSSLGYRPNGWAWAVRRGERGRVLKFVLERADWEQRRRGDTALEGIGVEGLGPEALDQFGLV
jgi:RimJ/RimL family protein N-acetyltransferase